MREANSVRQFLLTQIPTYAIDEITVRKNTSVYQDEYVSKRLTLIPLVIDATIQKIDIPIRICGKNETLLSQSIDGCKCVENIIVVYLNDGEEFEATMTAKKGTGSAHPKWSAVSRVEYRKTEEGYVRITAHTIGVYSPKKIAKIVLGHFTN
jgi:DNA-directed RNA polymerase alpha subunit